jgi:NTE family protein
MIAVNLSGPSATASHAREEFFTGIKLPKIRIPHFPQMIEPALRALIPTLDRGQEGEPDEPQGLGMNALDVVDRSLNLMQEAIRRYRLAGYPPDVLVNIPLDSCGTLDFHRAKEMITMGRERAVKAFDAWEDGETLVL